MTLAFAIDIRLAVLRSVHSALEAVAALDLYRTVPGADTTTRVTVGVAGTDDDPAKAIVVRRRPRRRARTPAELAVVHEQVSALIRPEPDQSIAELARTVGMTGAQLRSQLRQLAEEA